MSSVAPSLPRRRVSLRRAHLDWIRSAHGSVVASVTQVAPRNSFARTFGLVCQILGILATSLVPAALLAGGTHMAASSWGVGPENVVIGLRAVGPENLVGRQDRRQKG